VIVLVSNKNAKPPTCVVGFWFSNHIRFCGFCLFGVGFFIGFVVFIVVLVWAFRGCSSDMGSSSCM